MEALIWIGTLVTLVGLAGLGWCVREGLRAKRQETEDTALKARLQKVVAVNFAALAISALGLMLVIIGVFLS